MKWWQSTTMNRLITASIRVRLWWRAPHISTKTSWGNWSTEMLDWHVFFLSDMHLIRYIRFNRADASIKVNSMDWNPSGSHLMVGSDDSVVRIFNMNGDAFDIPSKKHGCDVVRFCNNTNTAIFASRYEAKIGAEFHKIRHLDIEHKTFLHYYAGHERQVWTSAVFKTQRGVYNFTLTPAIPSTPLTLSLRPGQPQPMRSHFREP